MKGNRQIKAGLGYTVGNILIKGVTFLTLPIFTRLMTTSQYGVFNTYMAYEAIIAIVLGLGMYPSIKNAKFDYTNEINVYVSTVLRVTLIPLFIAIVCVYIFKDIIIRFTGFPLIIIYLLIFQSYGTAMLAICNSRLALDYNYKKYLSFAFFYTFVGVGLSIILICFVFNENTEYGRIIGAASPLIILAIYIFYSEGKKGHFKCDKGMAIYAISFGLPMIFHYLSQSIQSQVDRIMITNMVDSSSTGIYSFAYSVAMILQVIYYSADNVWSVWFYEQMDRKNYTAIRPTLKKYIFLITSIGALMIIGSREFIMIMSNKNYWVGCSIFIPILLGIFMLFLYTIPAGVEYYYKKTKYIAIMTAIAAVVNVSLNYILIKAFGYEAAAYATLASYAVTFFGHWIIANRLLPEEAKEVFVFSDFIIPYISLTIIGVLVYFLNPFPLIKYAFALIFLSIIAVLRREDILLLRDYISKKIGRRRE